MKKICAALFFALLSLNANSQTLVEVAECFSFIEEYERAGGETTVANDRFINAHLNDYNKIIVPISRAVNNCRGSDFSAERHRACVNKLNPSQREIYSGLVRGFSLSRKLIKDGDRFSASSVLMSCSYIEPINSDTSPPPGGGIRPPDFQN